MKLISSQCVHFIKRKPDFSSCFGNSITKQLSPRMNSRCIYHLGISQESGWSGQGMDAVTYDVVPTKIH